jgi:archaellum component FlaG (FlaF/FlaG flagellin family)
MGHHLLFARSAERGNRSLKNLNKKLLLGVLCIAIIAVGAAAVVADTWISRLVSFRFTTGTSQSIALYKDCAATFAPEPWVQSVAQGQTYEYTMYVFNNGTQLVYITYLPTDVTLDGGQTHMTIAVDVLNYGVPCEMVGNNIQLPSPITSLPYALPEKKVSTPSIGFPLGPNKMIKLDVKVTVLSVDLGTGSSGSWPFNFEVVGVSI